MELKFTNDGNPEQLTSTSQGFFFSSVDDELWFSNGTKQGTYLVKDFMSGTYDEIAAMVNLNNKVYFSAETDVSPRELYVSDGTENGTIALTSRTLGATESTIITDIYPFGDKVYFSAVSENSGQELWVTDGTFSGTFLLTDIVLGPVGSSPNDFFEFNGSLFFSATTPENGTELWVTDGTEVGTRLFKELYPGTQSGLFLPTNSFVATNSYFFFYANAPEVGRELWRSDGTPEGTILVKDIRPGVYDSNVALNGGKIGNRLIFEANDGTNGSELWISDGTESGTNLLIDLNLGNVAGVTYSSTLTSVSEGIYFKGSNGTDNGLWFTDGTQGGIRFLSEVNSGRLWPLDDNRSVVFYGSMDYQPSLWVSDGTPIGTRSIAEPQASNSSVMTDSGTLFGGKLYFSGKTQRNGTELWVTDGTSEGTELFYDLKHAYGSLPSHMTPVGNRLFFRCNEYGYYQLGTSDGTFNGTRYLSINPGGQGISEGSEFIDFNGRLAVSANDGIHGYELWMSDGTSEGTYMVKDINPGSADGLYNEQALQTFYVIGDQLYFMARDGNSGYGLWVTDGTEAGTTKIADNSNGVNYPNQVVELNGTIYFTAGGGVYKINPGNVSIEQLFALPDLRVMKVINNRLLMVANTSNSSYGPADLWISDGTSEGTSQLASYTGGIDSDIRFVTILNDELYFVAQCGDKCVIKTDGTSEGTLELFKGFDHPFDGVDIDQIITCGNYVYFGVQNGLNQYSSEVWRTDGSVEGTVKVAGGDGANSNIISELKCYKGNLVFNDRSVSNPLFMVTAPDSQLSNFEISIDEGSELQSPGNFTTVNGFLFFEGTTPESGSELFVADAMSFRPGGPVADSDNDGIIDILDKCPNTPEGETVNSDGCGESQLDDDQDGVFNSNDACPGTPLGEGVDPEGCSSSQIGDDDSDGVLNFQDSCPGTPAGEEVDQFGCSASQRDEDQDGVPDSIDKCPGTESDITVDANGCPVVLQLPLGYFHIIVEGESCWGKNNGEIRIIPAESGLEFTASIGDQTVTSNEMVTFSNTQPGTYQVCVTLTDYPDFEQCFMATVTEGQQVSGKSEALVYGKEQHHTVTMTSGTPPYFVHLNGQEIKSSYSRIFTVTARPGDRLEVFSSLPCEGVFEKDIKDVFTARVSPNPFNDWIYVEQNGFEGAEVDAELYDSGLRLISKNRYNWTEGRIKIPATDISSGIYYLKLQANSTIVLKIIKK